MAIAVLLVGGAATAGVMLARGEGSSGRPSAISARTARSPRAAPRPIARPRAASSQPKDCTVIDELARDWMGPPGPDETDVQRSERLADKARDTADSVSDATLKADLNRWADGFSLLAESQRLAGDTAAPDATSLGAAANTTITSTADQLRQACPEGWPSQP